MATRTIIEHTQRHSLGREIELFVIDMSKYDLGVKRMVGGDEGATVQAVTFDGEVYEAWPVTASGWKRSSDGSMARPSITVANVSGVLTPLIAENNDLKGCTVTRIRTYERYLDDGEDPDPSQILPLDVYEINRLQRMTNTAVQFELVSMLDKQDVMLPGRQVVRDYCSHTYRRWNGSSFDYTNATCPYVGTDYFTAADASTTAANDKCGKRLPSCLLRFVDVDVPIRAFPGVARRRA